jgi:hypothetical protein
MSLEDLERIAGTSARADRQRAQNLQKTTTWRWLVCLWPFIPIWFVILTGELGTLFALFFFVVYPGYTIWTALGTLVAALRLLLSARSGAAPVQVSEYTILGHINEGPEMAHVLARVTAKDQSISVTALRPFTVNKVNGEWRAAG